MSLFPTPSIEFLHRENPRVEQHSDIGRFHKIGSCLSAERLAEIARAGKGFKSNYGTGSYFPVIVFSTVQVREVPPTNERLEHISLPGDLIREIKSVLSLSVTDLAKILRVERPTVYAWMRDSQSIREHNLSRVETISEFAKFWKTHSKKPLGSFLTAPNSEGQSILELLCSDELDTRRITRALQAARFPSASERPKSKMSVRELARGSALSQKIKPSSKSAMEVVTRRPFDDD